ncbi:MAG: FMN-binding protein [Oscillospiraceae bacterium]|jgi:electron transport complex protein RnfG|nr:FMN-binding protein [Oscillospiraceae bacterium]
MAKQEKQAKSNAIKILFPALSLFVICLLAAAALAVVNNVTKAKIEENKHLAADLAREEIFPAAVFTEKENGLYYEAHESGGALLGYVMECTAQGYGGEVKLAVGVHADGRVARVRLLAADGETPGLGQNIGNADWLAKLVGKSGSLVLNKDGGDVDAVVSATYSSRAAVAAVNEALAIYQKIQEGGAAS